ncbi:MAG: hypothetical protein RL685_551 [Pseudomonadota bacterium]|jgi:hypothetical protein
MRNSRTLSPRAGSHQRARHAALTTAITGPCHSWGIPRNNDTVSPVLLAPKRIDVSHIFSQFVLEETQP